MTPGVIVGSKPDTLGPDWAEAVEQARIQGPEVFLEAMRQRVLWLEEQLGSSQRYATELLERLRDSERRAAKEPWTDAEKELLEAVVADGTYEKLDRLRAAVLNERVSPGFREELIDSKVERIRAVRANVALMKRAPEGFDAALDEEATRIFAERYNEDGSPKR